MKGIKISPFDAADYLKNEAAITEYLTAVLEENDPDLLVHALGDVAKARGMTEIAKLSGLGRESLYKALRKGAKPQFATIMKIISALNIKLCVGPKGASHA